MLSNETEIIIKTQQNTR